MKKIFILLFGLFTISSSAQMSMEDCMRYAVQHSITTQRTSTSLENSKQQYTNAIANHFPNLSASIGVNSTFGRGIDPETNSYINTATFNNGVGADLGWSVFNGLTLINRTRNAKIAKIKGEYDLQRSSDEVAENTMVAFAEVVYCKELVELSKQRVEAYKTDNFRMERMVELGTGSNADLAQLTATLATEEYSLISRQNNYDISIIKLKDVMNFPLDEELELHPTIAQTKLANPEQELQSIQNEALAFLPKSLSFKQTLKSSKIDLQIAQGSYSPSIRVGGGLSTSYFTRLDSQGNTAMPYGEQFKNNLGQYISASMSIPIFNNLSKRTNVHIAKNNYKLAQANYNQSIRELESEIKQASLEVKSTESQWVQAQKNVKAQKIANAANRRKYEQGLLNIIELQTSDNQLFMSEIELRNSYLRHQIKVRQLNYYKGLPYFD